ncbi:glycerol-3-phosphate 1-O-acyltransferase PlsY [Ferrigenium sp. UT5]|uniref:glycerol-3-phosphate 1-O-acyltransferase PlsY n=1 Tax=Ferrigenium sp. UT5 TaxID=3242105 RepID=UPI00355094F7
MTLLFFVVAAYLLGSISFAVLTSKVFGLDDPRSYGSGNPGATNVLRSGKKGIAALTLFGDVAKGWLAVFLAIHFAPPDGNVHLLEAAVALAAFIGHIFPVFHKFKGGKGVATALGVLLGINPWMGVAIFAAWLLAATVFRYSSLAALIAAIAGPVFALLIPLPLELIIATVVMTLLLIWRHKSNIRNLLAGKENKIGSKKKEIHSA